MITAEQRANRKNHLGSSDLPAILGYSRFSTPYDVWLEKTGRIPYDPTDVPTDYQEAGNFLELSVLQWALDKKYIGNIQRDPELPVADTPIVVHIDAVDLGTGNPVEVKTEGLYGPIIQPWGDAGSNEVPEYTCIQCHGHLMATGADICHVPTFLGGRGFGYFYVERDEKLVDLIREAALKFWHEYVLKDTPPPESVPSLDLIKKIRRVEGEPVELADELIEAWLEAKKAAKDTEEQKNAMRAKILAALDGHQEGTCSQGLITNYEQSSKGYEVGPKTFRVMRLKKAK
jgi:predicted phage-related endonuclease